MPDVPPRIILRFDDDGLALWNAPAVLLDVLVHERIVLESSDAGHQLCKSVRPLYWTYRLPAAIAEIAQLNVVGLPVGMLPVVIAICSTLNLPYQVIGNRLASGPGSLLAMFGSDVPADPILHSFICSTNNIGVIRCGRELGISASIVAICRSFPSVRIAVCTSTKAAAVDLRVALRAAGLAARLSGPHFEIVGDNGILIDTPAKLSPLIGERAIVIFAGMASTRLRDSQHPYRYSLRAVKFLVVDQAEYLSPHDVARLRAWFGSSELHIPTIGRQARPICTVRFRMEARPHDVPNADGPLASQRAEIWRNGLRNRLLATLARDVACQGSHESRHSALLKQLPGQADARNVVVLVESPEHAAHIAERLPGWSIFAGAGLDVALIPVGCRKTLVERLTTEISRTIIATFAGAQAIDWSMVEVVVRADGGTGLPPIDPDRVSTADLVPSPLVIVDPDDRANQAGRRRFQQRQAAYEAAEWFQLGADPAYERFRRFTQVLLSRRPA